jgi:spermidine/putrescine transport system permease protein/putrescine transport system permease protein
MVTQTTQRRWPLVVPPLLWQLLFFALPLLFLIVISFWTVQNFKLEPGFTLSNWSTMLSRETFWSAYKYTWVVAFGAACCSAILAFPAAYSITYHLSERARRIALLLLVVPFFTSYLVRVYAWQVFLSDNGIINKLIAFLGLGPLPMLNTSFGTLIGYLTLCLPLVVLIQVMGMSQIDRSLIEAARNLRAGPWRTLYEVIVPAMKASLIVAWLFAFILSFGDFVSPVYLGGGASPTLSNLITDTTKSGQQWPRAAVVAITMIITLVATSLVAVGYAYKGGQK